MNYDFQSKPRGRVDLGAVLIDMERADLVRRAPDQEHAFLFKHALVQDTAYASLLKQERKSLHHMVAEALERVYADRLDEFAALLTRHFAAVGDDAKVVEYALRAGDAAMRLYAPAEARMHYSLALDALARLPEDDETRGIRMDTLVKQVVVSRSADEPGRNLARLDEAESIAKQFMAPEPGIQIRLARIYHWKGFVHLILSQPREALYYFGEAGALARAFGDDELESEALVHSGALLNFQGRFGEAEPLLRTSIDLMRKGGIPVEGLYAFAQLGLSLAHQGFHAEGLAEAQRGLAMALQSNHTGGLETCYSILVQIFRLGDDIPQMLETSRAVVETAQAVQDIAFVCSGSFSVAWAQSYLGLHQAALASLARARGILDMLKGQIPASELFAAVEAEIAMNAGRFEEAQALAGQAVSLARSRESLFAEGLAQRVWGQSLAESGSHLWDQAEIHLDESLRLFEQGSPRLEADRTRTIRGKLLELHSR